ncbi:12683_t:CDS:2, partial [Acaulospora colombiana]
VGAQAKQRRRKRKGKDGQEEDGSESETPARESVVRSVRGSVPPIVATSWQDSYDATVDGPMSTDQPEDHFADEYAIDESQAHPSQSSFSIGGMMGRLVNLSVRVFASILTYAIGSASTVVVILVRFIVSLFDYLLVRPASFVSGGANKIFGSDWSWVGRAIFLGMMVWLFLNSLYGTGQSTSGGSSWIPWKPTRPPPIDYSAPGASSAALADMARRLQEMENKVIDMQFSQRRAFDRLDGLASKSNEYGHKIDTMDDTLGRQQKARIDAEKDLRASSSAAMSGLRTELSNMIASISQVDTGVFDGRIKGLENRLIAAESGVKDAVDTSKQAVTIANSKGSAVSSGSRWWGGNSDGKSLTIKSTDGQDVTGLIGNLVELAVQRWGKDDIAKADYAGYFSGARVIPQLTTQTYKIEDRSFWGRWGMFGSSATEGRPPVTALHPDIHVGNCWPFKGSSGQIGVMLSRSVIISEVTIDHAAKEVAFDVRSAPKKMELWGLVDGAENVKKVAEYHRRREQHYRDLVNAANREGRTPPSPEDPYPSTLPPDAHYLRLAQFTYDVHAPSHIQTFSVPQEIQDLGVDIGIVVLMVRSNWGEPNWTCLYRLRVHGHDPDQRPYPQGEIDE